MKHHRYLSAFFNAFNLSSLIILVFNDVNVILLVGLDIHCFWSVLLFFFFYYSFKFVWQLCRTKYL